MLFVCLRCHVNAAHDSAKEDARIRPESDETQARGFSATAAALFIDVNPESLLAASLQTP
jgi:hypothetical protein